MTLSELAILSSFIFSYNEIDIKNAKEDTFVKKDIHFINY